MIRPAQDRSAADYFPKGKLSLGKLEAAAPVGRGMTDAATALPRFGVHSVAEKGVERVRNPVIVCGWATRRGAPH